MRVQPKQINFSALFTVDRVLRSRGFQIKEEGDQSNLLLRKAHWNFSEENLAYDAFDKTAARQDLLAAIENPLGFDKMSLQCAETIALASDPNFFPERNAFSYTYEWYVGEMLVRNFGSFSSSYGVTVADVRRNSDDGTAGDYDVLSVLGTLEVLYIECKTGRFDSAKIFNMLERMRSLHVLAGIMLIDRQVSEQSLKNQICNIPYPGLQRRPEVNVVTIKGFQDSPIYIWGELFFVYGGSSSADIKPKLRAALRCIECKRSELNRQIGVTSDSYKEAGYEVRLLLPMQSP